MLNIYLQSKVKDLIFQSLEFIMQTATFSLQFVHCRQLLLSLGSRVT